ncbi:MAG: glycosyltransferase family 2 protein, partial [Acidimicrobiales bacterium]
LLGHLADRAQVSVARPGDGGAGDGGAGAEGGAVTVATLNRAVEATSGSLVLLIDARVEPPAGDWLLAMAQHAGRPGGGPVGARLLTPAGRVHEVGLVLGLGGQPLGRMLEGLPAEDYGYLEAARVTRNWSAVSGACVMLPRGLFDELDGLDKTMGRYAVADLCLRAGRLGRPTMVTGLAEVMFHGGDVLDPQERTALPLTNLPSWGGAVPPTTSSRAADRDRGAFQARWKREIGGRDPYFSPHLSRLRTGCTLPEEDEDRRWNDLMWMPQPSSPG